MATSYNVNNKCWLLLIVGETGNFIYNKTKTQQDKGRHYVMTQYHPRALIIVYHYTGLNAYTGLPAKHFSEPTGPVQVTRFHILLAQQATDSIHHISSNLTFHT